MTFELSFDPVTELDESTATRETAGPFILVSHRLRSGAWQYVREPAR